jgi:starch-binding outer membrane protein, SusD/RagB family
MKNAYNKIIKYLVILIFGIILTTSCEDYLAKAPEINISDKDIFTKFVSFQGYLENAYQCIVDITQGNGAPMNYNFSDDVLLNPTSQFTSSRFDIGDYWFWQNTSSSTFTGSTGAPTNSSDKGYWQSGWYGIRLVNTALANLPKLVAGTQEERNLIEGQALFFRGYLHFEILRSWGGIPYMDVVLNPSDKMNFPRLTYSQTADRITADLKKAVELLPLSWEDVAAGQVSEGMNTGRITKGAVYGVLGKNLLYAASPLMNALETGDFTYNTELCKEAAKAFNEVFNLENQGYYSLEPWAGYKNIFYTLESGRVPGGKEIVFSNPIYRRKTSGGSGTENVLTQFGGWLYASPTENYIENYGMSNGLPIDAAGSGYNPDDPWTGRDPRFYYSILKDGDRQILNESDSYPDTFFRTYIGGRHRSNENSITGYGINKYRDITCNNRDGGWVNYTYEVPHMRLADIYLMYAEAVNEAYGPTMVPSDIPGGLTAVQALNKVRNRATVPDVDSRFLSGKEAFREVIRQERAVELAFEGHRWFDLRRWYVAHLMKYREKYVLEFDQAHSFFRKNLWSTIVFDDKHYWLPFPVTQVTLYPEFYQNPGW